jgi:hypothetical protein
MIPQENVFESERLHESNLLVWDFMDSLTNKELELIETSMAFGNYEEAANYLRIPERLARFHFEDLKIRFYKMAEPLKSATVTRIY